MLYQTLNGLKYLFKYNLDLIKLNVDNITIELLYFNKDGNILFGFKNRVEASSDVVLGNGFIVMKIPRAFGLLMKIFFCF